MNAATPLIYLAAGEASGDALGARLMAALSRRCGGAIRFAGVGGEQMRQAGLDSVFPMSDLAVMGLVEVLPRARLLLRRMRQVARDVEQKRPAALVTIDAPSFAYGVVKRLRRRDVPRIHYVAPQVWAWRPWRVHKYARKFDHILALLPFEPAFFAKAGLRCAFVGHPAVDGAPTAAEGRDFRKRHGLTQEVPLMAVLPGSRMGEVTRLLPVFAQTIEQLRRQLPNIRAVVPSVPALADRVSRAVAGWAVPTIVVSAGERRDAFAASDVALAASGTVSIELAAARVPHVIAYRANPITALLVGALLRVRYVNINNLILDRAVVPELLQRHCTPKHLAAAVLRLLRNDDVRAAQLEAFGEVVRRLRGDGPPPSERAADAVLDIAGVSVAGSVTNKLDREEDSDAASNRQRRILPDAHHGSGQGPG